MPLPASPCFTPLPPLIPAPRLLQVPERDLHPLPYEAATDLKVGGGGMRGWSMLVWGEGGGRGGGGCAGVGLCVGGGTRPPSARVWDAAPCACVGARVGWALDLPRPPPPPPATTSPLMHGNTVHGLQSVRGQHLPAVHPTTLDGLPPFSWPSSNLKDLVPHVGPPDTWDFGLVELVFAV